MGGPVGAVGEREFLRPRSTLAAVWAVEGLVGLGLALVAVRRPGAVRVVAGAGAFAVGVVLPVGFLFGSRVRRLSVNADGLRLQGIGLDRVLHWSETSAVDFLQLGPTVFLVARTTSPRRMPALTPFRRRFARTLDEDDPGSLLVVRTMDFPDGHVAISDALRCYSPVLVPVRGPRPVR